MRDNTSRDVFDFRFLNKNDEVLFNIDTAKSSYITHKDDYNMLIIEGALVDLNILANMMDGVYIGRTFKVQGWLVIRDILGSQNEVKFNIKKAKFHSYSLNNSLGKKSVVTIEVMFPIRTSNGDRNFELEIIDESWEV